MAILLTQRNTKITYLFLLTVFLSACATQVSKDDWPTDVPPRKLFVNAYHQQFAAGTVKNSLENHLMWVKRFYQGSIIYPIGWNEMTSSLLASLDTPERAKRIKERLDTLGVTICIEWAQSNESRKIDSSAVATWGSALRTSAERGEQEEFISLVEADVSALLQGKLNKSEISRERYYPSEDYDNF